MIGKFLVRYLCLFLIIVSTPIFSNVSVSSSVDKTQVSINDSLEYKLVISGAKSSISIDESFLKDFSVISRSSSQSYRLVNNEFSASQIKVFILRPQKTGTITIPKAKIKVEGKTLETNEIKITVKDFQPPNQQQKATSAQPTTQSSSSQQPMFSNNNQNIPQKNSDLFIIANTNKNEAYVGEEIIYNVALFRRYSTIDKFYFQEPEFQVISEPLERNPKTFAKQHQNKSYYVQEVYKSALFFYEDGSTIIPEAAAEVQINFFYGAQVIKSNQIALTILPLPEKNKPKEFSGLVGNYTINTQINDSVPVENKPIPIKINISGTGNLKQLSELNYQKNPDFKIYQSSTNDQITYKDSVKGSRTFEYIVVPKKSGMLTLPEFKFSYFSPTKKEYVSLKTTTKDIEVLKSNQVNTTASNSGTDIQQLKEDLRFIKQLNLSNKSNSKVFSYILTIILSLYNIALLIMILAILAKNSKYLGLISEKLKIKADKKALKDLELLKSNTANATVHTLQNILYSYLTNIIKTTAQSIPEHELFEHLEKQGISKNEISELKSLLDQFAFISYSPAETQSESILELIKKTESLIKRMK